MDRHSVRKSIDALKEIKGANTFYDSHVHPYQVMFDACPYQPSAQSGGLFSAGAAKYLAPELGDLNLNPTAVGKGKELDKKLRAMACLLGARRSYSHTGPVVFGDQMGLCGIDKVLLLPVMGEAEGGDGQLRAMSQMFGGDERFLFGYCVPNDIRNDRIADAVRRAVAEYDVRALKIHPSVTGIDLGCQEGIDRVEAILAASRHSRLKVVIHGGMSQDCQNQQAVSYGTVANLRHVDWSITPEAVVVAHGGCFGHSAGDACENVIPAMIELFERYDNLSFDTSGVGYEVLCHLLQRFDQERILFGSDALYENQWVALLKLWCALRQTQNKPEDVLLKIAGFNPGRLFDRRTECGQGTVVDVSSCVDVVMRTQ